MVKKVTTKNKSPKKTKAKSSTAKKATKAVKPAKKVATKKTVKKTTKKDTKIAGLIKIGDISKKTDINISTFRYYEKFGLLAPAHKTAAKYRYYHEEDIAKVLFIKKAQDLGFTLNEVKDLLGKSSKNSQQKLADMITKKCDEFKQKAKDIKSLEKDFMKIQEK
jgi:MerR family mercuric resistance operon transcriptional regulator